MAPSSSCRWGGHSDQVSPVKIKQHDDDWWNWECTQACSELGGSRVMALCDNCECWSHIACNDLWVADVQKDDFLFKCFACIRSPQVAKQRKKNMSKLRDAREAKAVFEKKLEENGGRLPNEVPENNHKSLQLSHMAHQLAKLPKRMPERPPAWGPPKYAGDDKTQWKQKALVNTDMKRDLAKLEAAINTLYVKMKDIELLCIQGEFVSELEEDKDIIPGLRKILYNKTGYPTTEEVARCDIVARDLFDKYNYSSTPATMLTIAFLQEESQEIRDLMCILDLEHTFYENKSSDLKKFRVDYRDGHPDMEKCKRGFLDDIVDVLMHERSDEGPQISYERYWSFSTAFLKSS